MNPDLQTHPLVVATVTQTGDLDFLQSGEAPAADILEFRLDNLVDQKSDSLAAMRAATIPVLATVRTGAEGGFGDLSSAERESLYLESLSCSNLIDIEVSSLREGGFKELIKEAGSSGIQRIGSFHDFAAFPGIDLLQGIIEEAFSQECEVAKLAVFLENRSDLFALAELVSATRARGKSISAMGMGPLGKLSRLVLPEAGSCLNYGYLQVPNAPGQWSAAELRSLLLKIRE